MPEIFVILLIVGTALMAICASEEHPISLLGLSIPIVLSCWLYSAFVNNKVKNYGQFTAKEVDGVAVLNINGEIINLNNLLHRNISEGEKFEVSTLNNMSKGIQFGFYQPFDVKPIKENQ